MNVQATRAAARPSRGALALAAALLLLAGAGPAAAQQPVQAPPASTADPADVATPDAILHALYDVISGPAGQARDWDRFRSLFVPGARLIPSGGAEATGYRHRVMTPEEYAQGSGPVLERDGFFETEIHRVEERYGTVLHAFSTYESRRTAEAEPFARGINSIQLFWDGTRWWVVSIFWMGETAEHPIPARYLPGG